MGSFIQIDAKELNIESLQDTATYKSKQQNIEGQVTAGYGFSASGSASKSNINANYASVNEQSGVFAGDDGYQINVKNNTDLKGAIITSTQTAENLGKNSLDTGTLTASDIHNVSEYDAKGIGISGSVNVGGGWDKKEIDKEGRKTQAVNKSVGFGLDSDKDNSTTHSGINTQNINIRDEQAQQQLTGKTAEQIKADIYTEVTTDTARENSGAIANNFDKDKVQSEINTQVEVTKKFDETRQGVKQEIYDYVDKKRAEAKEIRMATVIDGKNGYNTAESLKLEEEATKWEKRAFYLDAVAGALYGYGSTEALTYVGSAVVADPVKRAATAPQQIWQVSCGADSLYCADQNSDGSQRPLENGKAQIGDKRQIFDINQIVASENTGLITISNNGILNPLDDALKNSIKQNLLNTGKDGIYVVYNPPTTNLLSELLYAGYDKTNDLLGGRLPLTTAEKANIEIFKYAKDKGYQLDLSNHSRGGLTASVAVQNANRNGLTEIPLNKVRFYGTATNVQDFSDWLVEKNKYINPETNNSTGVYSAVHYTDFVGRSPLIALRSKYFVGGNDPTGGVDNKWFLYSHSSYNAEIPSKYLMNSKGEYIDKKGVVVSDAKKVENPYSKEFIEKWRPIDNKNPSLPVLVPSYKSDEILKYEVNPF